MGWRLNSEARGRVSRLLEEAGIPLELQVGAICRTFVETVPDRDWVAAEPVVYSPDGDVYREIDQLVTLCQDVDKPPIACQLVLRVPIECKSRNNVELFGFPEQSTAPPGFPLFGGLAGSQAGREVLRAHDSLRPVTNARISLVTIKGGQEPKGIYDEDLIYKSASALSDFIQFDNSDDYPLGVRAQGLLDEYRLGDSFKAFVEGRGGDWLESLPDFTKSIDLKMCENFNERFLGKALYLLHVGLHLPVVCIQGPIHKVTWTAESGITDYEDAEAFVTSIRKTGWPGKARRTLLNRAAEVPVIVTNTDGLRSVLDRGAAWFEQARSLIRALPESVAVRAPLESHFFDWAIAEYKISEAEKGYRSDFPILS